MFITKTTLEEQIVAAILEDAFRLLVPDNSLAGVNLRRARMREKAFAAGRAEAAFDEHLRGFDPNLLSENEVKEGNKAILETGNEPDVRLGRMPCSPTL